MRRIKCRIHIFVLFKCSQFKWQIFVSFKVCNILPLFHFNDDSICSALGIQKVSIKGIHAEYITIIATSWNFSMYILINAIDWIIFCEHAIEGNKSIARCYREVKLLINVCCTIRNRSRYLLLMVTTLLACNLETIVYESKQKVISTHLTARELNALKVVNWLITNKFLKLFRIFIHSCCNQVMTLTSHSIN